MQQSLEAVQLEIERASEVVETGLEWSEVASESWRGAELCDQVIAVCWHVGPTGGQNRQNVRGDAFVQLCFVPSQAHWGSFGRPAGGHLHGRVFFSSCVDFYLSG